LYRENRENATWRKAEEMFYEAERLWRKMWSVLEVEEEAFWIAVSWGI
jgi:ribonuclease HI